MCPHMYQGQGWSPVYTKPQHKKDNKNPTHPFSSSPAPLTHVKLIIVSWMRRATHVWPRVNQGWSRQVDMVGCVGTQVNMDQIIWYGGYGNILVCHKHVKYAFCRCLADTKVALKSQMFVCLSRIKTPKTGENKSLHLPPSIPTFIPPSTSPSSPSDTSTNYTIHQFTNLVPP